MRIPGFLSASLYVSPLCGRRYKLPVFSFYIPPPVKIPRQSVADIQYRGQNRGIVVSLRGFTGAVPRIHP